MSCKLKSLRVSIDIKQYFNLPILHSRRIRQSDVRFIVDLKLIALVNAHLFHVQCNAMQ